MSMKRRRFLGLLGAMVAVPALGPLVPAARADFKTPEGELPFNLVPTVPAKALSAHGVLLGSDMEKDASIEHAFLTTYDRVQQAVGYRKVDEQTFEFTFLATEGLKSFTSGLGLNESHDFYLTFQKRGEPMREYKVIGAPLEPFKWPIQITVKFDDDGELNYSSLSWMTGFSMGCISRPHTSYLRVRIKKATQLALDRMMTVYQQNGETSV